MTSQTAEPSTNPAHRLEHTVEEVRCYSLTFREGDAIIGRAQLHSSASHILEVVDLFIEPEFRGNGHAKSILDSLMGFARELGATEISAHTSPDNAAAYRAFQQMGFVPHHDEVHLEAPLSAKQTAEHRA
jgi:RimJ/RimL family protein N-acetyltransferase